MINGLTLTIGKKKFGASVRGKQGKGKKENANRTIFVSSKDRYFHNHSAHTDT